MASLAGYFHHDTEVNDIALALENYDESAPVVFHEYTHLLVANAARSVPVWLNEGLAEYYSTYALEADGTRAHIGRPIAHHVALLRERFIPLSQLIAVDTESVLYNEGERRSIFYAEAWALTHFLMIEMPNGPAAINTYASGIARGDTPDDAFRGAFGSAPAEFEQQLRRYIQQSKFRSIVLTMGERVNVETPERGREMSAGEAGAWLGDLQRRIGRRAEATTAHRSRGKGRARRSDAGARARPAAAGRRARRRGVGRVRERRCGRPERLLRAVLVRCFAPAPSGRGANAPVRPAPAIARAREALTRAAAINPSSSEAFAWLAYAEMMTDGRLREARAAIEKAIELAPGRVDYRLRYADIWILEGKIDEATALLTGLAKVKTDKAAVEGATQATGGDCPAAEIVPTALTAEHAEHAENSFSKRISAVSAVSAVNQALLFRYCGRASTTASGDSVGTTLVSANPPLASSARNSSAVRSRPPGISSISRSISLPRSG